MNVEDVEKDANAGPCRVAEAELLIRDNVLNRDDSPVGGAYDKSGTYGRNARRIAEEIETPRREYERHKEERPSKERGKEANGDGNRDERPARRMKVQKRIAILHNQDVPIRTICLMRILDTRED